MSGWIKIHRKITKWEWADKPDVLSLFIHLLLSANYEDKRWRGIVVKRGQLVFGRKQWSQMTGISEQSLRTCIERLKSTNEITSTSTNKFTIITIVKYEEYQLTETEPTSKSTNTSTSNQPATNQQLTTPKEVKKEIIPPISPTGDDALFNDFWDVFPNQRKGSKAKALTAWQKALRRASGEIILRGARRYAVSDEVKRGFAKGAAAWLNDDRWKSDYKSSLYSKPENRMPSPAGG